MPQSVLSVLDDVDGVIHAAFNHDFSRYAQNCVDDGDLPDAMAQALGAPASPSSQRRGQPWCQLAGSRLKTRTGQYLDAALYPPLPWRETDLSTKLRREILRLFKAAVQRDLCNGKTRMLQ